MLANVVPPEGPEAPMAPHAVPRAPQHKLARCVRCKQWMSPSDECLWAVRRRPTDVWHDAFRLCGLCTLRLLKHWGVETSEQLFPR